MKKLYIVDLNDNHLDFKINDSDVIYLSRGNVSCLNCKILRLNSFKTEKSSKKAFLDELKKKIKSKNNFFFKEFEIFNLRNDKNLIISKVLNLLKIKKFLKHKIKNKEKYKLFCISDNNFTTKILDQLTFFKIQNIKLKGKNRNFSNANNIYYYYFKFILKILVLKIFIKFFNQRKIIEKHINKNKSWSLSLYPNFYKENKELFFGNKFNKINFLFTDETHLNHSLIKLLTIYLKNRNTIINIESFIKFKDIYLSIKQVFKEKKKLKAILQNSLVIDNLNFKDFYKTEIINSFINRSKLTIYDNSIRRFINNYKINQFHLYLFEYNFGFYLIRQLKKNNCKIIGYQHGIYNRKFMWLDLIRSVDKKNFNPNVIISNNSQSLKDYKRIYKNDIDHYKYKKKKVSKLAKSILIKKKNYHQTLIISGTHDIKDLYYYCKNYLIKNKKGTFYIKTHPKNRFYFENVNRLYQIKNLKGKSFSKVIVSPTSTVAYDLKLLKKKFIIFHADYKSV